MKKDNFEAYPVREVSSIRELAESSAALFPDNTAFLRKNGEEIEQITYSRSHEEMKALATWLNSQGLEGKKIAVIGKNSYEWSLSYLAVVSGCGVIVPFDKELKPEEVAYLAKDSGISAILYSNDAAESVAAVDPAVLRLPMESFPDYLEKGRALLAAGDTSYENHSVDPNAMSILIYTSGTTGLAKGVMLSQANIAFDIVSVLKHVKLNESDRTLSLLPLHHTYQCMAGFLAFYYAGASIAFSEGIRHLQEDFIRFQPTVFIAVPLILESFLKAIRKKYGQLFAGNAVYQTQKTLSSLFKKAAPGLSRSIFTSVNKAFGGKMRAVLCGAASLSPEVFRAYESFGLAVYVGYGLTETSPVCLMHNDRYSSPHDVGFPIEGLSAKLVDLNEEGVGELVVKGPNVMLGYYNNPEETDRVLKDGWFYTGDLARYNKNGTYSITGRIKSMIVIQSGKKIFPEELEYYLEQSRFVKESLVFGHEAEDGTVQVAASIYPDYQKIDEELGKHKPDADSPEYREKVMEIITRAVRDVNRRVPHFKCIRKIIVKKTEFEKTTTRKIKRVKINYEEEENS